MNKLFSILLVFCITQGFSYGSPIFKEEMIRVLAEEPIFDEDNDGLFPVT